METDSESTGESGERFMPDSHKKAVGAILLVVVLIAGGLYYMNMQSSPSAEGPGGPEEEATGGNGSTEDTQRAYGLSPSQIEGEIVEVNITDINAEPASVEIAPEDGVRFVNQAGIDVQFSFDREIGDFTVSADESIIVDPTSIVYYDVTPVEENAEFRDISARINVQG